MRLIYILHSNILKEIKKKTQIHTYIHTTCNCNTLTNDAVILHSDGLGTQNCIFGGNKNIGFKQVEVPDPSLS